MSSSGQVEFLKWIKPFLDVTLLIALLSAGGYFVVFSYEKGYCDEFGIKLDVISIDLNTILQFSFKLFQLVTLVTLIFALVKTVVTSLRIDSKLYDIVILLNSAFIIFPIYMSFIGLYIPNGFLIEIGLIVITNCILYFLRNVLKMDKIKSWKDVIQDARERFGIIIYAAPIFIIAWLSLTLGEGEADKQTKFQIFTDSINYVVVRRYGDEFICKEINLKTKLFGPRTMVFKIGDKEKINFIEMDFGQLVFLNLDSLAKKN